MNYRGYGGSSGKSRVEAAHFAGCVGLVRLRAHAQASKRHRHGARAWARVSRSDLPVSGRHTRLVLITPYASIADAGRSPVPDVSGEVVDS